MSGTIDCATLSFLRLRKVLLNQHAPQVAGVPSWFCPLFPHNHPHISHHERSCQCGDAKNTPTSTFDPRRSRSIVVCAH